MHLWYLLQGKADLCSSQTSTLSRHSTVMWDRVQSKSFLLLWTNNSSNNNHSSKGDILSRTWAIITRQTTCGLNNSKTLSWLEEQGCKTPIWWLPQVAILSNSNSSEQTWWVSSQTHLWARYLQISSNSRLISIQIPWAGCSNKWTPWWCNRCNKCKCSNKGRVSQQITTKVATTPNSSSGDTRRLSLIFTYYTFSA